MTWNHDLTTAPQDGPIWLASKCGKVIKSEWIPATKHSGGRWAGVGAPVAWQPYIVPAHPDAAPADPVARLDSINHQFMAALDTAGGF